jgi:hypothetical protein
MTPSNHRPSPDLTAIRKHVEEAHMHVRQAQDLAYGMVVISLRRGGCFGL